MAARLAAFPRVAAERPELKQAAVALCVTEPDGVPSLLLTRRKDLMGVFVNRRRTTALAGCCAALIIGLNTFLIVGTFAS